MVFSFGRLQHGEKSSKRIGQGKRRKAEEYGVIVCEKKIMCTVNGRLIKCYTNRIQKMKVSSISKLDVRFVADCMRLVQPHIIFF